MIERQPYLPRFMAGGPGNPLGARAMYLGNTVYRIHGTNAPETIGQAVSSGCFRLVNDDVSDLYDRVPVGTNVIVRQDEQACRAGSAAKPRNSPVRPATVRRHRLAAAATDCAVCPNRIARSSAVRMPPWPGLIFGVHS